MQSVFRVIRGEKEQGSFPLAQIVEMLNSGELEGRDRLYVEAQGQWIPLAAFAPVRKRLEVLRRLQVNSSDTASTADQSAPSHNPSVSEINRGHLSASAPPPPPVDTGRIARPQGNLSRAQSHPSAPSSKVRETTITAVQNITFHENTGSITKTTNSSIARNATTPRNATSAGNADSPRNNISSRNPDSPRSATSSRNADSPRSATSPTSRNVGSLTKSSIGVNVNTSSINRNPFRSNPLPPSSPVPKASRQGNHPVGHSPIRFVNGKAVIELEHKISEKLELRVQGHSEVGGSFAGVHEVQVLPDEATEIRVEGPTSVGAGEDLRLSVIALDRFENEAGNYRGTLKIELSGEFEVPEQIELENGRGELIIRSTKADQYDLRLVEVNPPPGLPPIESQFVFEVLPGPAVGVVVEPPPQVQAGRKFEVVLKAVDQYGNWVSDYSGDIELLVQTSSSSKGGGKRPA